MRFRNEVVSLNQLIGRPGAPKIALDRAATRRLIQPAHKESSMNRNLAALLKAACGPAAAQELVQLMNLPSCVSRWEDGLVTRVELAQALNMALFGGLLARVPTGRAYTDDVVREGGRVEFDHGALRTVRWPHCGALPPGEAAITRILKPLGYRLNGTY